MRLREKSRKSFTSDMSANIQQLAGWCWSSARRRDGSRERVSESAAFPRCRSRLEIGSVNPGCLHARPDSPTSAQPQSSRSMPNVCESNRSFATPRMSGLLRLIGEGAQQRQMTLQFQSTGRTARREISVMTLASRVVEFGLAWLTPTILRDSLARLRFQARGACLAS